MNFRMPYVQRDEHGRISALTAAAGSSAEFLPTEHPEVIQFLAADGHTPSIDLLLADIKMIRVIEDLIDILISKNVIMFSELPAPVQHKLLQKKGQREKLFGGASNLIGSEEGIL